MTGENLQTEEASEEILQVNETERIKRLTLFNGIKEFFLVVAGIASATLGLKGFLLPEGLLDGGATGISLLINRVTNFNISILIMLINLPLIYIGWRQVSKSFAVKTFFAVLAFAVVVHYVELPDLTHDRLLIAVFGGFFLGGGIGLAMRGGAVIDGTEVLAVWVSRHSSLSVGDFIAIFNVILFSAAVFLVNLETALYSMLTYFSASKTIDFIITGIEEYIGVTIISDKAAEIKSSIVHNLGRAVTV